MQKIELRKLLKKLHLYIGLCTGAVVFIVCLTGCIYTFQKEIRLLTQPYYKVEIPDNGTQKMLLSRQLESYQAVAADAQILRVYEHKGKNRSTMLLVGKEGAYYFAFINPYTTKLLGEKALAEDFFYIVLYIHMNLLLGTVGAYIVKWSVLLFLISLLTGIVLWIPKNKKVFLRKKGLQSKFTIKKKSNRFMKRYQLHSVLGIYAASLLIVISLTGLGWSFSWIEGLLYTAVTFEKKVEKVPITISASSFEAKVLDEQSERIREAFPKKEMIMYFLPQSPTAPLRISAVSAEDKFGKSDGWFIHPQTGERLEDNLHRDKNRGEKLRDLYYDLHTGSILGVPGKILVFLASLIGASLPVTGFLLWRYRRRKRKKS